VIKVGDVLDEGEEQIEFLATAAETNGASVRCRVRVRPGRAAPPEHSHPNQEERFTVERGRLGYILGDKRLEAGPGEVAVVPPATNHTFWNAGTDELSVVSEVRPALAFEDFVETIHVLISDGRLSAGGRRANPLMMAVVAQTYRREWRLTALSPVARAMLPLVAVVGRLAGFRAHYSVHDEGRESASPTAV
jgi:mannose-6-phosphate isomerase-like protein (cupin superfamily)